ncbi:MAG: hypothetical protein EP330_12345 [Deltaproteobacteria bacterium]|nr:MAG: hypothetical protein EP330_12345 [Deltaproteobacteria bacterium]
MSSAFWLAGTPGASGVLEYTAPDGLIAVAAVCALLALALAWPGERSLRARLGELALWAVALAALVFMLARPVWVEESGRDEPGRVAVLVDASRSMSMADGGVTRWDQALALVEELQGPEVDVYHFGAELAAGLPEAPTLPETDVEAALDALNERVIGEKLAGVVLITDGLDRGLLRRRFATEEGAAPPTLPGPLTVYTVGKAGSTADLAVREVTTGGFAFLRSPFTIDATLVGAGYEGRTVRATLLRDGTPVTEQSVKLDEEGKGTASFSVTPDRVGRFAYEVRVPDYEDDIVPANNHLPVVVSVVRDKVRVLQVAGAPSWDVKVLRRFLKGDPSVDLVSFFILRTNQDLDAGWRGGELALIEFPHERLFSEELESFDLVIFQNFDHAPYFRFSSPVLLEGIAKYVESGHAFAMVGGDRSFDLGEYARTPLERVLPVQLSGLRGESAVDQAAFSPVLTDEGARHPITRLVGEGEENAAWWERLHPLDGTNIVGGPAKDAAVLLSHPKLDGGDMPVLAVREVGEGRTMALTVDSSWRWSFSEAAEGRGNQAYLRFWKNAIRWLIADPSTARVTVETGRENYAAGDAVRVVVRARDEGFAPMAGAEVKLEVTGPGKPMVRTGKTGPDGEVAIEVQAARSGPHRVVATVLSGEEEVGEASTVYAVSTRDRELDEVVPDATFLAWLGPAGNGRTYAAGESGPVVRDPAATRVVWDRRETPIWRAPLLALILALCAGGAWIVRRRAGLR